MKRHVACLLSCIGVPALGADLAELETHRARWEAAAVTDYVYAYEKYCECHREAPPETVVTVRDGSITRVHHEHASSEREVPARDGSYELYWTIDELFALAARANEAGAEVRMRYEGERGVPRELYVDYDPELIGDELDLRITRFSEGAR